MLHSFCRGLGLLGVAVALIGCGGAKHAESCDDWVTCDEPLACINRAVGESQACYSRCTRLGKSAECLRSDYVCASVLNPEDPPGVYLCMLPCTSDSDCAAIDTGVEWVCTTLEYCYPK